VEKPASIVGCVLRSFLPCLLRSRLGFRLVAGRSTGAGNIRRVSHRAGGFGVGWLLEAARQFSRRANGPFFGRRDAVAGSRTHRIKSQSMVVHSRRWLSTRRGHGARREAHRPGDGADRLCVSGQDMLVANGGAARWRNLGPSTPNLGGDYCPLLEAFFDAARVPEAPAIASKLSGHYRTLAELLSAEPFILVEDAGSQAAEALAGARNLMIQAATDELVRRSPLRSPAEAADFLNALIGFRSDEYLATLYLDAGSGVIDYEIIRGRPDSVYGEPRQIVLRAICRGAAAIILAHNHPSGDVAASSSDLKFTRLIADCCAALGIRLRDHLIVAGCEVRSAFVNGFC
jgi:DNA repair protein RadC